MAYSADKVEQLLKCPVCLDRLSIPKILPCLHTLCKTPCLEGIIDSQTHTVRCPECRMEHAVSENNADSFPNNITIVGLLDLTKEEDFRHHKHADDQVKLEITAMTRQIRRSLPKLSNYIATVDQRSKELQQQFESVKAEIQNIIKKFTEDLQERGKLLESELVTLLEEEMQGLRVHREDLELKLATMSSYCDATDNLLIQADSDISETDTVRMKNQYAEYTQYVHDADTKLVPQPRVVGFEFNTESMSTSISRFGKLTLHSPTTETETSVQGTVDNPSSVRNKRERGEPGLSNNETYRSRDRLLPRQRRKRLMPPRISSRSLSIGTQTEEQLPEIQLGVRQGRPQNLDCELSFSQLIDKVRRLKLTK